MITPTWSFILQFWITIDETNLISDPRVTATTILLVIFLIGLHFVKRCKSPVSSRPISNRSCPEASRTQLPLQAQHRCRACFKDLLKTTHACAGDNKWWQLSVAHRFSILNDYTASSSRLAAAARANLSFLRRTTTVPPLFSAGIIGCCSGFICSPRWAACEENHGDDGAGIILWWLLTPNCSRGLDRQGQYYTSTCAVFQLAALSAVCVKLQVATMY